MNSVFELGGSLVRREVAHNLMRLIAEGRNNAPICMFHIMSSLLKALKMRIWIKS